ncbi:Rv3235 family protein [Streptomyces sp. NPDC050617]|uniref:Rv3235 family protein n=1 Tax=Streptomyces sp. NPDC050617 TaxID=3154628 RepID=UPI0034341070
MHRTTSRPTSRTTSKTPTRTTTRPPADRTGNGRPAGSRPGGPTAPPRRGDRRGDARRPAAALAARRRERELLPRYWFANRLLLTLSGQRPAHWMLGHTLGAAYDRIVELAPQAPLRPAAPGGSTPVVRYCDEFSPRSGVIEAFARIASGDRVRALAFRLERGADERWRCSAVELGEPART